MPQEITKAELQLALTKWGMTSKYGHTFSVFVDSEFERLDQNGDGSVSAAEFRACYGRFHLLYRSSVAAARQTDSGGGGGGAASEVTFSPGIPAWMREEAISATDDVLSLIHI